MSDDKEPKTKLWTGVGVIFGAILLYNLYSGLMVKKIGIPGFEIEFGENSNKKVGQPTPVPTATVSSPSPVPSPSEAPKDGAVEARKQATLTTWNRMQDIDSTFPGNPNSEAYKRMAYLYEQLDMSNVDPLLVTHVKESIAVFKEAMNLHMGYESEAFQIQQSPMDDWQKQSALQQLRAKYQPYVENVERKLAGINDRDKDLARKLTEKYDISFADR